MYKTYTIFISVVTGVNNTVTMVSNAATSTVTKITSTVKTIGSGISTSINFIHNGVKDTFNVFSIGINTIIDTTVNVISHPFKIIKNVYNSTVNILSNLNPFVKHDYLTISDRLILFLDNLLGPVDLLEEELEDVQDKENIPVIRRAVYLIRELGKNLIKDNPKPNLKPDPKSDLRFLKYIKDQYDEFNPNTLIQVDPDDSVTHVLNYSNRNIKTITNTNVPSDDNMVLNPLNILDQSEDVSYLDNKDNDKELFNTEVLKPMKSSSDVVSDLAVRNSIENNTSSDVNRLFDFLGKSLNKPLSWADQMRDKYEKTLKEPRMAMDITRDNSNDTNTELSKESTTEVSKEPIKESSTELSKEPNKQSPEISKESIIEYPEISKEPINEYPDNNTGTISNSESTSNNTANLESISNNSGNFNNLESTSSNINLESSQNLFKKLMDHNIPENMRTSYDFNLVDLHSRFKDYLTNVRSFKINPELKTSENIQALIDSINSLPSHEFIMNRITSSYLDFLMNDWISRELNNGIQLYNSPEYVMAYMDMLPTLLITSSELC